LKGSNVKQLIILLLTALALLMAAGCQGVSNGDETSDVTISDVGVTLQPNPGTSEPYIFKTSEPGKISLHGVLIVTDPMYSSPDPDDAIFFVPIPEDQVATIPPFVVGEVPQADVDERTGEFMFINIEPGKYAVVVTSSGAQMPARMIEGSALAIFDVTENDRDKTIELGYLLFP
jgi:hypothetical protein